MRKCKHIDLEVPAETEVVIEGRFLPNVRRPEGPFGEFMGYYVPVGSNAVFEVLANNDMNEVCMATPALTGDMLLVRTKSHLYALRNQPAS